MCRKRQRFGRLLWTKRIQARLSGLTCWEFSELDVLELELFPPLEIQGMTLAVRSQHRPQTRIRVIFKYSETVTFDSDILIVYIFLFQKLNL